MTEKLKKMAKDSSFYFSHDYNARNDVKIKNLLRQHGMLGYGVFWAIVEDLYNNANALQLDCESIAFDLRVDYEVVKSVIFDFKLFEIKDVIFASTSVQRRLDERNQKSVKARLSALSRWDKSDSNANALQSESDSYAIKERKGKEIKERKEIKEKKEKKKSAVFCDLELGRAYFTEDGTVFQELGVEQKKLLEEKKLKYYEILEGEIF